MPLRTPPIHCLRATQRCLLQPTARRGLQCHPPLRNIATSPSRHAPPTSSSSKPLRPKLDSITLHRLTMARNAHYKRRMYYSLCGVIFGMVAMGVTCLVYPMDIPDPSDGTTKNTSTNKLDSDTRKDDPLVVLGRERKVVVQKLGEEPEERSDTVATGTSTVPEFPRVLEFADSGAGIQGSGDVTEYQLLGLGVRTVSFLSIQVYVVGLYVATDDIASLQSSLIKRINSGASTLVAGEKDTLRQMLKDPEMSEEIWNTVLRMGGLRTLVRIVPTRNTDFGHLRDAWVRALTARAQKDRDGFGDENFGVSVGEFKKLFNRGSVPKGKELLLSRDRRGKLAVWYDDGKAPIRLGAVADERVSRVVWMGYLAGKNVASEKARESIIEGIMEFVERPVGTVASQVHSHVA